MKRSSKHQATVFLVALAGALVPVPLAEARDTVLNDGHYGLAVSYDRVDGWHVYINEYETGKQLPAHRTICRIDESAQATVPADPEFRFLGPAGQTVWILPEIYDPEILYMGIGAPLLERNIFTGGLSNRGQISMQLIGIEGTGPAADGDLAMWQAGFPPKVFFSTSDGIGPEDALHSVTANFHAHFNWGFTQPGLYRLRFRFSGTLVPELGGAFTETEAVYTVEVVHAGNESPFRYAWPVENGWSWSSWMGYLLPDPSGWWLSLEHGWFYPLQSSPDSCWFFFPESGWVWTSQLFFPWVWSPDTGLWSYHPRVA